MHRQLRYAVLATALFAGTAFAGARQELDTFTRGLKGLDGQFSQQVSDANGRVKERASGRVALSAPRQFRWEYAKPYNQLIVADGKKVWVFDPDLEQVTVRAQGSEEQNSPLVALIDPARLDKQYDVSEEAAPRDGLQWLSLTPKVDTEASFRWPRWGSARMAWPGWKWWMRSASAPRSASAAGSATRHSPPTPSATRRTREWTWSATRSRGVCGAHGVKAWRSERRSVRCDLAEAPTEGRCRQRYGTGSYGIH